MSGDGFGRTHALTEWKVKGSKQSYHDWQQARAANGEAGA